MVLWRCVMSDQSDYVRSMFCCFCSGFAHRWSDELRVGICDECLGSFDRDSAFAIAEGADDDAPFYSSADVPEVGDGWCVSCGEALDDDSSWLLKVHAECNLFGEDVWEIPSDWSQGVPVSHVCVLCGVVLVEGDMFCDVYDDEGGYGLAHSECLPEVRCEACGGELEDGLVTVTDTGLVHTECFEAADYDSEQVDWDVAYESGALDGVLERLVGDIEDLLRGVSEWSEYDDSFESGYDGSPWLCDRCGADCSGDTERWCRPWFYYAVLCSLCVSEMDGDGAESSEMDVHDGEAEDRDDDRSPAEDVGSETDSEGDSWVAVGEDFGTPDLDFCELCGESSGTLFSNASVTVCGACLGEDESTEDNDVDLGFGE